MTKPRYKRIKINEITAAELARDHFNDGCRGCVAEKDIELCLQMPSCSAPIPHNQCKEATLASYIFVEV